MNHALLLSIARDIPDAVAGVDLGFDGEMAAGSGIGLILTRLIIYPAVMMRRRKVDDGDDNTGAFYVPRSMQGGLAVVLVAAGAGAVALLAGAAVLPMVSSGIVGLAVARATQEATPPR